MYINDTKIKILLTHLHPHVTAVLLQLFARVFMALLAGVDHQIVPFNRLENVWIMGHVQADLDLLHGVLVAAVRVFKVEHQLAERTKAQRSVHKVSTPTHTQGAVAAVTVNAQHHMMEVVSGELGLKADGEPLHRGQTVG